MTTGIKTALFSQKQSGGVYTIASQDITTGNYWFVDSNTGVDSVGAGQNPDNPFKTLNFAISRATANKGDRILLMPGHAETIEDKGTESGTTTDELTVDTAGVRITGLGYGTNRPTFTLGTASDATVNILAPNTILENIRIIGALADVISGIILGALADGSIIRGIEMTDASGTEILVCISVTAACSNIIIEDNNFFMSVGDEATECIELVGASNNTIIQRNKLYGDWKGAGGAISCAGAASTGLFVADNDVSNQDASVGICMDFHATSKGFVLRNHCGALLDNTLPITGGENMFFSGNMSTDEDAVSTIQTPESIASST